MSRYCLLFRNENVAVVWKFHVKSKLVCRLQPVHVYLMRWIIHLRVVICVVRSNCNLWVLIWLWIWLKLRDVSNWVQDKQESWMYRYLMLHDWVRDKIPWICSARKLSPVKFANIGDYCNIFVWENIIVGFYHKKCSIPS